MQNYDVFKIEPWIIEKCFDFWRSYPRIQEKIGKINKGLVLIGSWTKNCLELCVKQAILESLNKSAIKKQKKLKEIIEKAQKTASNVLKLAEKKQVIQTNIDQFCEGTKKSNLKEIKKIIEHSQQQQFSESSSFQGKKNLQNLLKEKFSGKKHENNKEKIEDSASVIDVSEELFNLTYKSPHSQDLRQKFLINSVKKEVFPSKMLLSSRENSCNSKKSEKKDGFFSSRQEKSEKKELILFKMDRKNSVSIKKQINDNNFDEYELNLREIKENPYIEKPKGLKTKCFCI